MAGGIGIFRAEGRPEGVNVAECKSIGFRIQLPAYRKIGRLAEKVLAVIHLSLFCFGHIFQIQSGHLEHFSGSFTVASRDQGCMHINKISFLEIFMNRIRCQGTDTENSLERIRPGTQM